MRHVFACMINPPLVSSIKTWSDKSPIVEHLAGNCVGLSRECLDEEEAWAWLAENHSSGVGKASDQAWKLLERILNKADGNGKQTRCHRAATRKILSLDCTVPYWLATSYKTRNPAELISVYHQAGFLEEATQVLCFYKSLRSGFSNGMLWRLVWSCSMRRLVMARNVTVSWIRCSWTRLLFGYLTLSSISLLWSWMPMSRTWLTRKYGHSNAFVFLGRP